jgi:hypothetical protein
VGHEKWDGLIETEARMAMQRWWESRKQVASRSGSTAAFRMEWVADGGGQRHQVFKEGVRNGSPFEQGGGSGLRNACTKDILEERKWEVWGI